MKNEKETGVIWQIRERYHFVQKDHMSVLNFMRKRLKYSKPLKEIDSTCFIKKLESGLREMIFYYNSPKTDSQKQSLKRLFNDLNNLTEYIEEVKY